MKATAGESTIATTTWTAAMAAPAASSSSSLVPAVTLVTSPMRTWVRSERRVRARNGHPAPAMAANSRVRRSSTKRWATPVMTRSRARMIPVRTAIRATNTTRASASVGCTPVAASARPARSGPAVPVTPARPSSGSSMSSPAPSAAEAATTRATAPANRAGPLATTART